MKVNIDTNFHDFKDMMDDLGNRDIGASARTAINRAMTRGQSQVVKQLKKDINLRSTPIKDRITIIKAKGTMMHKMEGVMIFSGNPIPLKEFVIGPKTNIEQKGIKIRKRRKIKVKFKPGKTIKVAGAFIQKVNSQQLFRHKGKGRRVRKLAASSLAVIAFRQPRRKRLEDTLMGRFDKVFKQQLQWRHSRTSMAYSKTPMRIPK